MILILLASVAAGCVVASFVIEGPFSGVITALGLVAGLLLGGEWREVSRMYHQSIEGEHHMPNIHPLAALRRTPMLTVLITVAIVQALVAALLIYVLIDFNSYQQCMSRWQQANGVALQVRADANEAQDEALDAIVLAVSQQNREAMTAAVQKYVEVRQLQTEGREKNPIPPLPQTVCGEVGGG